MTGKVIEKATRMWLDLGSPESENQIGSPEHYSARPNDTDSGSWVILKKEQ